MIAFASLALAAALALAPSQTPAPAASPATPSPAATATPNPDVLFARARATLAKRSYPRSMGYDVAISTTTGGTKSTRHYRTIFRSSTGTIAAHSISEEEAANPVRPGGFTLSFFGLSDPGAGDPLGIPRLSPEYTFGLVPYAPILPSTGMSATFALPTDGFPLIPSAEAQAAFPFSIGEGGTLPIAPSSGVVVATPSPMPAPATGPKSTPPPEIGRVRSVLKIYDISYAGEVKIGDATTWHLRLKPLLNPGRYRVRDLYIDESDDQVLRMRTEGNFTLKDLGCYWDIDFQQIGPRWFISTETANQAVDGFDTLVVSFGNFHDISQENQNLTFGISGSDRSDVVEEP